MKETKVETWTIASESIGNEEKRKVEEHLITNQTKPKGDIGRDWVIHTVGRGGSSLGLVGWRIETGTKAAMGGGRKRCHWKGLRLPWVLRGGKKSV